MAASLRAFATLKRSNSSCICFAFFSSRPRFALILLARQYSCIGWLKDAACRSTPPIHLQDFRCYRLHLHHVLAVQFQTLSCLLVSPIKNQMGM